MRGLQAADFTVLEDGQPRPIRSFEAGVHAAAPAAGATASVETTTGVATNQAGDDAGRLIKRAGVAGEHEDRSLLVFLIPKTGSSAPILLRLLISWTPAIRDRRR